jgi:hypothetical protein
LEQNVNFQEPPRLLTNSSVGFFLYRRLPGKSVSLAHIHSTGAFSHFKQSATMAFSLRFLILAAALMATTAFAPSSQVQQRTAVPTAVFSSIHHDDETDANAITELAPLALKMAGVLAIKTAKDIVNYPPQLFDQFVRQTSGVDQTNPAVLLAKLLGVLLFKFAHDAVYYPMVWTQRMIDCQSLDECEVE